MIRNIYIFFQVCIKEYIILILNNQIYEIQIFNKTVLCNPYLLHDKHKLLYNTILIT